MWLRTCVRRTSLDANSPGIILFDVFVEQLHGCVRAIRAYYLFRVSTSTVLISDRAILFYNNRSVRFIGAFFRDESRKSPEHYVIPSLVPRSRRSESPGASEVLLGGKCSEHSLDEFKVL